MRGLAQEIQDEDFSIGRFWIRILAGKILDKQSKTRDLEKGFFVEEMLWSYDTWIKDGTFIYRKSSTR